MEQSKHLDGRTSSVLPAASVSSFKWAVGILSFFAESAKSAGCSFWRRCRPGRITRQQLYDNQFHNRIENKGLAFYGQAQYAFSERWKLAGGPSL